MYVVRCYKIHFRIRGELCVGLAWLLSLISFILLILVHVGSINLGSASRSMMLVKVNTTNYGAALATGLPAPQPISNLYASNASKPLATGAGLRTVYQWGLYTYCGFFPNPPNKTGLPDATTPIPQTGFGSCGNTSAGARFQPFGAILSDMADNYTSITQNLIGTRVAFRDDGGMGGRTHAAYYLITIGTALCFLCLLLGIVKSSWAFFLTFLFALVSAIMLLVGAALWASAIHSAKSINAIALSGSGVSQPLGIVVSSGNGMSMLWAAFGLTIASLVPYLLSCCTYRG